MPVPSATLLPTPVNFGNVADNATVSQILTLTNTGTVAFPINSSGLKAQTGTAATYAVTNTTCSTSLGVGLSCTYTISYQPTAPGNSSISFAVTDTTDAITLTAVLSGVGVAPPVPSATLLPTPVNFGNVADNATVSQILTLTNTGTVAFPISNSGLKSQTGTAAAYTVTSTTCTSSLATGLSCTYTISYQPTAPGSSSISFAVTDSADAITLTAVLSGTGVVPAVTDFSIAATTQPPTIQPGASVQVSLAITPVGGSFNSAVNLSVSGLPAGSIASFSPPSVTPGSSTATSVLSVQTPAPLARLVVPGVGFRALPVLAVLFGLPLLGLRRVRRRLSGAARLLVLVGLSLAAIVPLSGCNGGIYNPAPQSYTLTITGTSGSVQHSTTVTLNIQ